jgi:hypothetical protein
MILTPFVLTAVVLAQALLVGADLPLQKPLVASKMQDLLADSSSPARLTGAPCPLR